MKGYPISRSNTILKMSPASCPAEPVRWCVPLFQCVCALIDKGVFTFVSEPQTFRHHLLPVRRPPGNVLREYDDCQKARCNSGTSSVDRGGRRAQMRRIPLTERLHRRPD